MNKFRAGDKVIRKVLVPEHMMRSGLAESGVYTVKYCTGVITCLDECPDYHWTTDCFRMAEPRVDKEFEKLWI